MDWAVWVEEPGFKGETVELLIFPPPFVALLSFLPLAADVDVDAVTLAGFTWSSSSVRDQASSTLWTNSWSDPEGFIFLLNRQGG